MKNILAITGKPGLFKLVSRGNNMLIVESLLDGKRMPTYARDKIVSLADVSMFTTGDDIALSEVLTKVGEKEGLKPASTRRRRTMPLSVRGSQRCCPTGTKTASIRATYANSSSGTTSSLTQESPISASRRKPQLRKKWKQKTNCSFKR